MRYTLDVPFIKRTGKAISIVEYSVNDKWYKPKHKIGTEKLPITDETLTEFIEQFCPEEICLLIIDKKGEHRPIDFPIEDFEIE